MEGREVVSLGDVGHGELSEGFFGLTNCPLMCEDRAHRMADGHHRIFCGEVVLSRLGHGDFWFLY